MGATMGVMVFYGISMLLRLFGVEGVDSSAAPAPSASASASWLPASLRSTWRLDFDFIEKGSKAGLPKQMEWVGAVGLLVTVVWLYLEILRLLSKLNQR